MTIAEPDFLRSQAAAAQRSGDHVSALALIREAVVLAPGRADLHNSAGSIALAAGEAETAFAFFSGALERASRELSYAINLAIVLGRLGRPSEALGVLETRERSGRGDARYCSTRASLARQAGRLAEAQSWYAACLKADRNHGRGLHGLARVMLERGIAGASDQFAVALSASGPDPELRLGRALALEAEGRIDEAVAIASDLARSHPRWTEPHKLLAQIGVGRGVEDFSASFRQAAEATRDPTVILDWCECLAGAGKTGQALAIVSDARRRNTGNEDLALVEAVYAGETGDDSRAEDIFSFITRQDLARWLHEARHRIRRKELQRASALLDQILGEEPFNVVAWALRDVVWRLSGTEHAHRWLHGQPGLISLVQLDAPGSVLSDATRLIEDLHKTSAQPIGQSVRGGTQTRGGLFDRPEPQLYALRLAIEAALSKYRNALPPTDSSHPLLRAREMPWRLTGSWSIRLAQGAGHHVAHVHPHGLVSSALYLELPAPQARRSDSPEHDADAGCLEIGRPADDLRTGLGPLVTIRPEIGTLALFPSTIYHGTRPFRTGSRMSVAFDVALLSP